MMKKTFLLMAAIILSGCGGVQSNAVNANKPANSNNVRASVPLYTYDIVKVYPHDPAAFTQGLVFHGGLLYEGTGGRGSDTFHSSLRKVEIETGKVLQKHDLAPQYFGEGIALLGEKIYLLNWREHTAFVYNLNDLKP